MKYPKAYGFKDAVKFLQVSQQYFARIVNEKKIHFQKTSSGRIFFEPELIRFKNLRMSKAKTDKRVKLKK